MGVEPTWRNLRGILSPLRLPIPPHLHNCGEHVRWYFERLPALLVSLSIANPRANMLTLQDLGRKKCTAIRGNMVVPQYILYKYLTSIACRSWTAIPAYPCVDDKWVIYCGLNMLDESLILSTFVFTLFGYLPFEVYDLWRSYEPVLSRRTRRIL